MPPGPVLSVVVPAHDEAANLERLVGEVRAALAPTGIAWELLVVDDGSTDGTPALLARLATDEPRLRPLRLAERSGQTAALVVGFHAARGTLVATLDADLQCAPAELPALLDALGDADLACGIRTGRNDPPTRRLASLLANGTRRLFLAPRLRDLACPLRVFRDDALPRVLALGPLFDGAHRWLPALFHLAGLRVVQRPIPHLPRLAGTSKYTTRGRLAPIARELLTVLGIAARRSWRWRAGLAALLLGVAALPFLHGLGAWPLLEPDEARNAEVAREMLEAGTWSVPHFNGLPYLDKPVLLFWMIAAGFQALGTGELAARLPSALAALATVGLTYRIARRLLDLRRAIVAAAVVSSAPLVLAFGRTAIFDMPLTALMTAALLCLLASRASVRPAAWLAAAGLAMGLATLTKGPVGLAVPLVAWLAARGVLPAPRRRPEPPGILGGVAVWAAVVLPWLLLVLRQQPDFLRYAFVDETLLRFSSTARFHRGAPVWYYAGVLAWALGGWGIVLAAVAPALLRRWRAGGADAPAIAFAVRAAVAIVVFFTLSASKRPAYILPAMVPLALLVAIGVAAETARAATALRLLARVLAVAGACGVAVVLAGRVPAMRALGAVSPTVLLAGGGFLVAWGLVTLLATRGRPAIAIAACALLAPGFGMAVLRPLGTWAESRSSRGLAARIEPGARVVCFETFRTGLPFYLRRAVVLATDGTQLTSNYVAAQRRRLPPSQHLVASGRVVEALQDGTYAVISPPDGHRLQRLTAHRLVPVYADHHSVLLRAEG